MTLLLLIALKGHAFSPIDRISDHIWISPRPEASDHASSAPAAGEGWS